MAVEIELKYRVESHAPIRERLRAAGAVFEGVWLEQNHLFDTPRERLRTTDCGLRLRVERRADGPTPGPERALLTFKGPRSSDEANGSAKRRSEFEAAVDDADTLKALLVRLGLRETVAYEKRRERWRLGEGEVVLDELPRLGLFVEIEGAHMNWLTEAAQRLGLCREVQVDETYVALAAARGDRRDDGGVELRF